MDRESLRVVLKTLVLVALAFAVGLLFGACGPLPVDPEPPPKGDPAGCDAACARMRALDCEEARPTPDGATCEQWCRNAEESGIVTLNPSCLAQIDSCGEIDSCTSR